MYGKQVLTDGAERVPLATIAWYGKLPSHGDFLYRRVPGPFLAAWDDWLQRCIVHAREQLGSSWLQTYLTSPLWRFFLCDGVIGATNIAGVVLPSVDKVGRCFPLTIFAELPRGASPRAMVSRCSEWLAAIEVTALSALETPQLRPEDFDAALQASAALLQQTEQSQDIALDVQSAHHSFATDHWRVPLDSNDRMAATLTAPLLAAASRDLRPLSLWWTEGSERVAGSCLLARSLPMPARVTAMLDGAWVAAGWDSDGLPSTGPAASQ